MRLTPRQAQLLQMLMNHHGEVVERERLFRQVWNTDYTGDTRTLDVHISWLRRAIELAPDSPTAFSLLAISHAYELVNRWSDSPAVSARPARAGWPAEAWAWGDQGLTGRGIQIHTWAHPYNRVLGTSGNGP